MENEYVYNGEHGGRYQLRHAAGLYWLIDMKQSGSSYISPVPLNEVGAELWKMFESKMPENEICGRLCEEYGITPEQAREDVNDFVAQLRTKRIIFGGTE